MAHVTKVFVAKMAVPAFLFDIVDVVCNSTVQAFVRKLTESAVFMSFEAIFIFECFFTIFALFLEFVVRFAWE